MAEFHQRRMDLEPTGIEIDGFARMGRPIPWFRRELALSHCYAMGITDRALMFICVSSVALYLERDQPYKAMEAACQFLDLTGAYRLFAVLLTAESLDQKPRLRGKPATMGESKCD